MSSAASSTEAAARDLRDTIDSSIEAGDFSEARRGLAQLWHLHPGPAQAGFVISRSARLADGPAPAVAKIAVLRSFTVEPFVPLLRAAGAVASMSLDVTVGGFNTYAQEILDPSSPLYQEWEPDIAILAVHTRDIAPELWNGLGPEDAQRHGDVADRVAATFTSLIRAFRERSGANLVVHGLEVPAAPRLGLADRRQPDSQIGALRRVNAMIAERCDDTPGVYFLDWDGIVADCGRHSMFDEAKWTTMRLPVRAPYLWPVAEEWLRFVQPLLGRVAKVVAVDLDNTLWGGVIGEDGLDGIELGPDGRGRHYQAVQRALLDIRSRGVLLAVCSKNNHDDAIQALDGHPEMLLRTKHFSAIRANWDDKASSLRSIAAELNLGVDAIAFLDDNPAERLAVATSVPEAIVIDVGDDPSTFAEVLLRSPFFERLSLSSEDGNRALFYEREQARVELQSASETVEDFLMSLATSVVVGEAQPADVPRLAELTQKTNQFNLTTRRYTTAEVSAMVGSDRWRVYALRAVDRFGDHGLVALALVETAPATWRIDSFLMSCRVIGRDVESALLSIVSSDAVAAGAGQLVGEFVPTPKNAPAANFYERHGFSDRPPGDHPPESLGGDDADLTTWVRDLALGSTASPDWVAIERSDAEQVDA